MCAGRVQALIRRGVQKGVQKWQFARATCRAGNPVIVHPQILPATFQGQTPLIEEGLSYFDKVFCTLAYAK